LLHEKSLLLYMYTCIVCRAECTLLLLRNNSNTIHHSRIFIHIQTTSGQQSGHSYVKVQQSTNGQCARLHSKLGYLCWNLQERKNNLFLPETIFNTLYRLLYFESESKEINFVTSFKNVKILIYLMPQSGWILRNF